MRAKTVICNTLLFISLALCSDTPPDDGVAVEEEWSEESNDEEASTLTPIDELVIDEVSDDHAKQYLLFDRNYNSSFSISVPILTVIVPGTAQANGVVKFSVSHLTLLSMVMMGFAGLIYPVIIGPHGKLHRSLDGESVLDRIEAFLAESVFEHFD